MSLVTARASAKFDLIAPAGFQIIGALVLVARQCDVDLTITCGSDSHGPSDPHSTGEAYDVSVQGFAPATIARITEALRETLGGAFTVLYECPSKPSDPLLADLAYVNPAATGPHWHLQRRKNTTYPQAAGAKNASAVSSFPSGTQAA